MPTLTLHRPTGPFWTVPNVISIVRLPLAVVTVWLLEAGYVRWSAGLMVITFLSDGLDGAIARLGHTCSEWGKVLDPLSDKLVVALIGAALAHIGAIPWWVVAVLVARDVLVASGAMILARHQGEVPASNFAGKTSTALLALFMLRAAYWPPETTVVAGIEWLGIAAVGMLLLSTGLYIVRSIKMWRRAPPALERVGRRGESPR
ncbi:MAG: CDP-alcohol phosphatidyltransferase family protein [Myxococcales bacterium FL481]|nr:MAG: CDP-alcohol phosphatidyltransferase family protein [Myxococcales bacterium FL481]